MLLHYAAMSEDTGVVRMLIDSTVDGNAQDAFGTAALHVAAFNDRADTIDMLIEGGANLDVRDEDNSTLHIASHRCCEKAVFALLKHVAEVNAQDNDQDTPLSCAAAAAGGSRGAAGVVDLLLRSGADETMSNTDALTAGRVIGANTEQDCWQAEHVERVRELLADAPADRTWRRRGLFVVSRAKPDRVRLRPDSNPVDADKVPRTCSQREPSRAGMASGGIRSSRRIDDAAGGGLTDWVARVLKVEEEGIFREIVGCDEGELFVCGSEQFQGLHLKHRLRVVWTQA